MTEQIGPGHTRWKLSDDGSVTCIRWNDPSWATRFASPYEITANNLPSMLRKAYVQGLNDRLAIQDRAAGKVEL